MAEVRRQDILLRVGGNALRRYGVQAWSGSRRVEEFKEAHTRADAATCARFTNLDGVSYTAGANVLRIDYPPGALDPNNVQISGPLSEGSRANNWTRSTEFSNAAWTKTNCSISTDQSTGPDGTLVDHLLESNDGAPANHQMIQTFTGATDNTLQTFSFIVRPIGRTWCLLQMVRKDGTSKNVSFNLSTGAVGTADSGMVGRVTHKWVTAAGTFWRVSARCDVLAGGTTPLGRIYTATGDGAGAVTYQGNGSAALAIWHGQYEPDKTFESSPIITVASAVTRAADALTVPVNWGPATDITVLATLARPPHADGAGALGVSPGIFSIGAGAAARIGAYFDPANRNIVGVIDTATTDQTVSAAIPSGNPSVLFQFKSLTTGGQVAMDTGSGLSAFSSAATAFSAFSSQTLRIGRYDDELFGTVGQLLVLRGLFTRAEALAVP